MQGPCIELQCRPEFGRGISIASNYVDDTLNVTSKIRQPAFGGSPCHISLVKALDEFGSKILSTVCLGLQLPP